MSFLVKVEKERMNDLNYIFFEEFKKLDKLCSELYQAPNGVTHYIDDMKAASWDDCRYIPNWKTDLKELIRLRHIRNHLAHTEGAFLENICTPNDINWIRNFHQRIMNQSDPLAMLSQLLQAKRHMPKPDYSGHTMNKQPNSKKKKKTSNRAYLMLTSLTLSVVVLLIAFFIILYTIY